MTFGEVMAAVGRGFRRAASFSGRDARRDFWPYAIFLVLLNSFLSMLALIPEMTRMFERIQRFARENPDKVSVESGPGHYSVRVHELHPELLPDFGRLVALFGLLGALTAALLAAAIVRRLHDRDRSGLWALMPVPFMAFGFLLAPRLFASFAGGSPDPGLFLLLLVNNICYLGLLVVLIVILAQEGTRGPNRFGEEPPRRPA